MTVDYDELSQAEGPTAAAQYFILTRADQYSHWELVLI